MPKKSNIFNLPLDIIKELNQRLQTNGYTQFIELSDWLESQGFEVSKSALHRYAIKLKLKNGFSGKGGSVDLAIEMQTETKGNNSLNELYQELGLIEYQKSKIIKRISELETDE